jgi:hypothetical protein
LELIFSRFGKILSCEVIRDKKTGDSLQYAFIEFENQKDCEQAYFKMQGVLIDDHRIHVDFSQSVGRVSTLAILKTGLTRGRFRDYRTRGGEQRMPSAQVGVAALVVYQAWKRSGTIERWMLGVRGQTTTAWFLIGTIFAGDVIEMEVAARQREETGAVARGTIREEARSRHQDARGGPRVEMETESTRGSGIEIAIEGVKIDHGRDLQISSGDA